MISRARLRRAVRRETVGVDVLAALNLVGALLKYLSAAFLFPGRRRRLVRRVAGPVRWSRQRSACSAGGCSSVPHGGRSRWAPARASSSSSLTWLLAAALGAIPYMLSGADQVSHPLDAYFEAMSGFTTTGASILTDIPGLSRSMLMWRQFSQWIGGMGIIVLALAVLPRLRVGGRQLFEIGGARAPRSRSSPRRSATPRAASGCSMSS